MMQVLALNACSSRLVCASDDMEAQLQALSGIAAGHRVGWSNTYSNNLCSPSLLLDLQ